MYLEYSDIKSSITLDISPFLPLFKAVLSFCSILDINFSASFSPISLAIVFLTGDKPSFTAFKTLLPALIAAFIAFKAVINKSAATPNGPAKSFPDFLP